MDPILAGPTPTSYISNGRVLVHRSPTFSHEQSHMLPLDHRDIDTIVVEPELETFNFQCMSVRSQDMFYMH